MPKFTTRQAYQQASFNDFKLFMQDLINFPSLYLETNYCGTSNQLVGLELTECTCVNTGAHNRLNLFSSDTRTLIEKSIVNFSSKQPQDKPLHILSMGSAGYLQELMKAILLLLTGLKQCHYAQKHLRLLHCLGEEIA